MRLFKVHSQRYIDADKITSIGVQGHEGNFQLAIETGTDTYIYQGGLKTHADAEGALGLLAERLEAL